MTGVAFSAVRATTALVAAGRAPACWQADLARSTRTVSRLARLCAWVHDAARPRLRDHPLFGERLTTLCTASRDRPDDPNAPSSRPPATPGASHEGAPRPRAPRADDHARRRPRHAPTPAFSGRPSTAPTTTDTPSSRVERPRAQGGSGGRRPTTSNAEPGAPSGRDASSARQASSITPRADRRLLEHLAALTGADPVGDSARDARPPRARIARAHDDRTPAPSRPPKAVARRLDPPRRSSGRRWVGSLAERTAQRWELDPRAGGATVSAPHAAASRLRFDGPRAPASLLDSFDTDRSTGHATAEALAPALTPSLPPLEPPGAPYEPPVPVATPTLRRGARDELRDTEPSDSLALTARIKQILDDEARRHGIDV